MSSFCGQRNNLELYVFWAAWSNACLTMLEIIKKLEKKSGRFIKIHKISIEKEEKMTKIMKIHNIPTIIIMKNGREIHRIPGTVSYEYLCRLLDKTLKEGLVKKEKKSEQ